MNRRDKQLLLTSKKLRALVPPFYSFRKEKKNKGKLSVSPPRPCSKLCADEQVCTTFLF